MNNNANPVPESDTRNVEDRFKGLSVAQIVEVLDSEGVVLEVAIENTLRDFNMGSIVRTANAFGVRRLHIVGRRQWNKRGAMKTDAYMHLDYYSSTEEFVDMVHDRGYSLVAVDNVPGSQALSKTKLPEKCILLFGQEGPGLSRELIEVSDSLVAIEQFGSTRSLNVSVAAGVVMYIWLAQHKL